MHDARRAGPLAAICVMLASAGCVTPQASIATVQVPRTVAGSVSAPLATQPPSTPASGKTPAALPKTTDTSTSARAGAATVTLARLEDAALTELSGLAVSPGGDALVWAVNDSGHDAVLFALDAAGSALGQLGVDGRNRDWESLDSGFIDGVATLLVGDTGDNLRHHDMAMLLLIPEPDPASLPGSGSTPLQVARRVEFRFNDGPHNVEAMALDDGVLWMLDKAPMSRAGARVASGIYRLDLNTALAYEGSRSPVIAHRVATFLAPIDGLKAQLAAAFAGVDLGYPTELDLDADRGHAWVLTYRDVLRYDRAGNEPWSTTLARAPARVRAHGLAQAEAMTVLADGSVLIASEGLHAQLLRIELP